MTTRIPYTLTNESINLVWKGKTHTVSSSAPNFASLREALIQENWKGVEGLLSVKKTMEQWADNRFKIKGDVISYEGAELPPDLTQRIVSMVSKDEDPRAFFRFWERLQKNPSYRSVKQLWSFLNHQGIPLTSDGCFLAYKSVGGNYKDHHSGKFDNSPGVVNEMPRNKISDDPNEACHEGFHVGALAYAKGFHGGPRIVVCKVDPADVVCVPYDESAQKMRVCRYKVVGNHGTQLPDSFLEDEEIPKVRTKKAEKKAKPRSSVDTKPKAQPKRKVPAKWRKFDAMDVALLMKQPISELRTYASQALQIVGASKIPGGKVCLVQCILQTRWQ